MADSTHREGNVTICNEAKLSVKECARVKAVNGQERRILGQIEAQPRDTLAVICPVGQCLVMLDGIAPRHPAQRLRQPRKTAHGRQGCEHQLLGAGMLWLIIFLSSRF